jgi:hypothetical protein
MRIPNLDRYRNKTRLSYFQGLPWDTRQRAYQWLNRFIKRREATHGGVPGWLFAIYCGQAKRLALNPPTPAWGRSMLAKRGGLAVQRRYRLEGRDATARATRCRVVKQNARKRAREEGKLRDSMGLPAPARVKYLPLD